MTVRFLSTSLLALQLWLCASTCTASEQPPANHDRAFWQQVIANQFHLPADTTLASATLELASYVEASDPELRDQIGYEIQQHFLHDSTALAAADLNALYDAYLPYVLKGLGEKAANSVFARSFAMLNLKELAAVDLTRPFLTQARFDELFAQAELALRFEIDLRGYDEKYGWAHATAHAADLMRILARNSKLTQTQQARLIAAIAQRARSTPAVFVWGEDARLARALMLVLVRNDFNSDAFQRWFERLAAEQASLWQGKFQPKNYVHIRSQANVLTQLAAMLARNDPSQFPAETLTALNKTLELIN